MSPLLPSTVRCRRQLAIARAILDGFDNHYRRFRYVAQQAKALVREWQLARDPRASS